MGGAPSWLLLRHQVMQQILAVRIPVRPRGLDEASYWLGRVLW